MNQRCLIKEGQRCEKIVNGGAGVSREVVFEISDKRRIVTVLDKFGLKIVLTLYF